MEEKMTAVEFLIAIIEKNVNTESIPKWENWKKVVKDVEKQQIIDAFIGFDSDTDENIEVAKKYYEENYGK